ncbi:ABC-type dipeptide/oligopeptide/nickel transport system, permease component [Thermobacillus composti KWC4]|uniref:ABC-type dipeptide/oligopeptide/nickel transport system, permease component n=1 Tax=Thermobacillus composti (strain DSM 18247 / JCM 13945 / KWC4) TaxID=717605 RepID=L0EAI6_THECK|nr:ABC transporter permease [Thermobacillus composti]AGA56659.1 ABC-type dipeptide/oligopeptide/nickel transport system, permease component [Thermobacillus composti KWC4]REJ11999.1 MAG: ABC transporter permease [Paenibacillaceae bacterium]
MNAYTKYFVKKAGWYLATLIVALMLNFLLPRLIEGNPVSTIASQVSQGMTDSDSIKRVYENFAREFGIDKPLIVQFGIYLKNLLTGDLGTSFGLYPRKVSDILGSAVPWTVGLQLPAILVGWILGNVLGAVAAYRKGVFDKVLFPVALFINSIPFFTLAIMMLYLFGITLKWFPISGGYDYQMVPNLSLEFIWSVIRHHTLPFLSIVLVTIGGQAIGMREMAIYELNSDYVLYSKLLGIRDSRVARYVFRNAMLPQITGLALSLGTMIGGSLICEIVFSYPGIGTWLFTAIRQLDYPLISGCTLLIAVTVLLANFTVEIIYGIVDPRIKAAQMEEG